jgi:hypothetical protein
LNKASLERSVVGRTGSFLGAVIRLPFKEPEIIRISLFCFLKTEQDVSSDDFLREHPEK